MESIFKKCTYGHYIITALKPGDELKTREKDYIAAGTINWLSQLSFEPPMFGIAIGMMSDLNETIDYSEHFTVHILSDEQADWIEKFAKESLIEDGKINGIPFKKQNDELILADTIGHFTCKVEKSMNNGDHTLHIGRVVNSVINKPEAQPICTKEQLPVYTKDTAAI